MHMYKCIHMYYNTYIHIKFTFINAHMNAMFLWKTLTNSLSISLYLYLSLSLSLSLSLLSIRCIHVFIYHLHTSIFYYLSLYLSTIYHSTKRILPYLFEFLFSVWMPGDLDDHSATWWYIFLGFIRSYSRDSGMIWSRNQGLRSFSNQGRGGNYSLSQSGNGLNG